MPDLVKRARIALAAFVLCLVGTAPAHAAFAPDLTVALDPPVAADTPAITMAITHAAGGSPIRRFTLALPTGFSAAGAPGAAACARTAIQLGECRDGSRVGTFAGRLAGGATFAGSIHKTGPTGFGLNVSVLGGSVAQLVVGSLAARPDGSLNVRLERLPALPITGLVLRLDGGPRGLVRTAEACGSHTVDGLFTSRLGELAIDRTSVALTGCTGVPAVAVANIRFSRKRFRVKGRRAGRGTIVAWWASRAADHTRVRVERRKRGRWRRVGAIVGPARAGDNRIRWNGRVRGRTLKPGRYAVRIQPAGSAPSKRVGFRIRRR